MKRTLYAAIAFFSLAVCSAAWQASAQHKSRDAGQPVLTQAQKVIAEELEKSGADIMTDQVWSTTLSSFKGCNLRYRKVSLATSEVRDATVDLAQLDPERVTVRERSNLVSFSSKGRARTIKLSSLPGAIDVSDTGGDLGGRGRRSEFSHRWNMHSDYVHLRSHESAMRLRDALEHGIRACQSQKRGGSPPS
jgi:hypothetical protein